MTKTGKYKQLLLFGGEAQNIRHLQALQSKLRPLKREIYPVVSATINDSCQVLLTEDNKGEGVIINGVKREYKTPLQQFIRVNPCYCCGGYTFYRHSPYGDDVCTTCHPPTF